MIISANLKPNKVDFDKLLVSTVHELNIQSKKSSKKISRLIGRNLEPYVRDIMKELAIGTIFENSIELIGGQKFPDIIAKKYFGIEVKTTTQNHWRTTGNSILESTRVEDVDRIFMLFAKLADPIEFRCRPYEDVLSEVVVTHSPRYLIDMNLEIGNTIFDKLNISYDVLRKTENPIRPIVEYYKSKLKSGEELWWMDSESSATSSSVIITVWNNLSVSKKIELKNKAMVYFPELFGNTIDKFSRIGIWLVTREAIMCPNVRDLFTAGGRTNFEYNSMLYKDVPRIFFNLFANITGILDLINNTHASELSEFWRIKTKESSKLLDWVHLISNNAKQINSAKNLEIKNILLQLIPK